MSLLDAFRRWSRARQLRKCRIGEAVWLQVVHSSPLLASLNHEEQHRLRELASLFLCQKQLTGAGGLVLDEPMRVLVAAQACLLILNLSLDYYQGWHEVIVYPDAFIVPQHSVDGAGVVHASNALLSGEAWGRGPVILSWADIRASQEGAHDHGVNVVLHEFAHKLDLLNGPADGMPPLHPEMERKAWTHDFTRAYERMLEHIEGGHYGAIDPYAVESPAEFFAVVTEFFFARPAVLQQQMPAVYARLAEFYRQNPLQRVR